MPEPERFELLFIEDEDTIQKQFREIVSQFNKHSKVIIEPTVGSSVSDGLKAIKENHYDGAIIDLRLSTHDEGENGNHIIREIKKSMRFPVVVYSGHLQHLDSELAIPSPFFRITNRTDKTFEQLFEHLLNIYHSGITRILGGKGEIIQKLNDIFWRHIANSYDEITNESAKGGQIAANVFMRMISTHLVEHLGINDHGEGLKYISGETYIYPPIKEGISTGEIYKHKSTNNVVIVLTPACDVVIRKNKDGTSKGRKAEKLLIVDLRVWNTIDSSFKGLKKDSSETSKKELKEYIKNNRERYHFLPSHRDLVGYFIDFQSLSSVLSEELESNYDRIAAVSNHFLKDIIARFAQYYSRQGQPDYYEELVLDKILPDK